MSNFRELLKQGQEAEEYLVDIIKWFFDQYEIKMNNSDDINQLKLYDFTVKKPDGCEVAVEVKNDKPALRTGNLYLETMFYGKRSGLKTTKANIYAFVLSNGDVLLFPTDTIIGFIKANKDRLRYLDGVPAYTEGYLVPIRGLREYAPLYQEYKADTDIFITYKADNNE